MARIRPANTGPEMVLRQALWNAGLRYRLNLKTPAGRPDLAFPNTRIAVYVDGCQWHGCPIHYVAPRTSRDFWSAKLLTNVERDRRQTLQLESMGWKVLRFWEHEVFEDASSVVARVLSAVKHLDNEQGEPAWRVVRVDSLDGEADLECRHLQALRAEEVQRVEVRRRSTSKWSRNRSQEVRRRGVE